MRQARKLRTVARRMVSNVLPDPVRVRLSENPAAQRLAGRLVDVEGESNDREVRKRARERWEDVEPEIGLTWGVPLTGTGFIGKVVEHAQLHERARLFEVGPGYGRLVESLLAEDVPFGSYVGLDLSARNVDHLEQRFDDPRLSFMSGDIESAAIPAFDVGFSSLTFKHIYPSFEAAAMNIASSLAGDGRFIFDLVEGSVSIFEDDGRTFIRRYQRDEVEEILGRAGMEIIAWDVVRHDDDPRHNRQLVVARLAHSKSVT